MLPGDVPAVVALQPLAFPPPFNPDYHWDPDSLLTHLDIFPEGQFVADLDGTIVGSCSNTQIAESQWQKHANWYETVGGPELSQFDPAGSTLYGLDISVHPGVRRQGIGHAFYRARFALAKNGDLMRYGTACRIPDFAESGFSDVRTYARAVVKGERVDRTLTPLLRYGLTFIDVIHDYMEDAESANTAALLEWSNEP
jgi:ribosomal protein S18 acetylase RimI-like enzyme